MLDWYKTIELLIAGTGLFNAIYLSIEARATMTSIKEMMDKEIQKDKPKA